MKMFKKVFNLKIISFSLAAILIFNITLLGLLFPQKKKIRAVCCIDSIGGPAQNTQLAADGADSAIRTTEDAINSGTNVANTVLKVEEKAESWTEKAVHIAGYVLMHQILNMITNDIIAWINGGGKPRFISDWKGFLTSAADKAAGAFLNQLAGINLCEPFSLDLRIALMPTTNFPEEVSCSFSEMGQFFDDFRNEGWKGWAKLTSPENNFYGAYFKGIDQRMSAEAAAEKAAENEGIASKGFLGVRCTPELAAKSGCKAGEIVTPGEVISNMTNKTISKDFDTLQASIADMTDSLGIFAPYVIAIGNALINRVIKEGLSMVAGGGDSEQLPIIAPSATEVAQATNDQAFGDSLTKQHTLLINKINNDLRPNQSKNLAILNIITNSEKQIMDILVAGKTETCPITGLTYTFSPDSSKSITTEISTNGKTTTIITPYILDVQNIGTADVENKSITTEQSDGTIEVAITNSIVNYYPETNDRTKKLEDEMQVSIQLVEAVSDALNATEKYDAWLQQNQSAISKNPTEIAKLSAEEQDQLKALKLEGDTLRYNAVLLNQAITKSSSADLQILATEIAQATKKAAEDIKTLMLEYGAEVVGGLKQESIEKGAILTSVKEQLSKCQEKVEL